MGFEPILWAYVGPDMILPLTSVLAGIVGIVLICWRFLLNSLKAGYRLVFRKKSADVTRLTQDENGTGEGLHIESVAGSNVDLAS